MRFDQDTDSEGLEALNARELARLRRRDHDAGAQSRALMRSGQAKAFKQILDAQAKAAHEPLKSRRRQTG